MSKYKLGKDIAIIEQRLNALEDLIKSETTGKCGCHTDNSLAPNNETESIIDVELVYVPAPGDAKNSLAAATQGELYVVNQGECTRTKTGFPDFRWYSFYSGNVWLQHRETGEKIVFSYIQSASAEHCNIVFGDVSQHVTESRDTHIGFYGAGKVNGQKAFSSWVKFRFSDGSGYNISRITCYC